MFCTVTGALHPVRGSVAGGFKVILKRAGLLESTRPHDLRHSCATLLLGGGVHPRLVQVLLGHSSTALTLDLYSHGKPGMGEQDASAMEAALSS